MAEGSPTGEITRLLQQHAQGSREAFDRLMPLVSDRLRAIARQQLARSGRPQTLNTLSLVHEAYLQLVDETGIDWQDRGHFYAICARAMRRILVDAARRKGAAKRGSGKAPVSLELEPGLASVESHSALVLAVDEALERLASFNPRLEQLVECRFFAGMTEEETAEALEISVRTAQRDWTRARAWLQKELA